MAVGTASDYAALLKEYQAKQAGVKKWEDIFLQPYQTAAEQVSTQTQYDISGAFAQYKKSQLSAMQNMQLGTGFKEQIASDLASQYGSAYSQLKQEEVSQLGQLQTSYLQTLAQQEEALIEQGEQFAELENKMFEFAGITRTQAESEYGAELGSEGTGLGYFENKGEGVYNITERGVDFYDELLNLGVATGEKDKEGNKIYKSFRDYLLEQEENELYDFYTQNSDIVKQLVGGLESGDVSYDSNERNIELKNIIDSFKTKYKEYYNEEKQFESSEVEKNYYKSMSKIANMKNQTNKDRNVSKTLKNNIKNVVPNIKIDIDNDVVAHEGGIVTGITINIDSLTEKQKEIFKEYGFVEQRGGFMNTKKTGKYDIGVTQPYKKNRNVVTGHDNEITYIKFIELLSKL